MTTKPYTTTYSSDGRVPTSTYSSDGRVPTSTYSSDGRVPTSTYSSVDPPRRRELDLCGLSWFEALYAIRRHALAKLAAEPRGIDQRKAHEAHLRRQGYDEEFIRRS